MKLAGVLVHFPARAGPGNLGKRRGLLAASADFAVRMHISGGSGEFFAGAPVQRRES